MKLWPLQEWKHERLLQKEAVNAIYNFLNSDNAVMDRKYLDVVEIDGKTICVENWGCDLKEAARKQDHAVENLVKAGLIVDELELCEQGDLMPYLVGVILIPIGENGGLRAIIENIEKMGEHYNAVSEHAVYSPSLPSQHRFS